MSWLEVAFELKSHQVEEGTQLLEHLGALAVSCYDAKDEPIFEPPPESEPIVWQDSILVGLMDKDCPIEAIKDSLLEKFPKTKISAKALEDKNWVQLVQAQFPPQQYGNLWVCPSWADPIKDEQAICLHLDPGMAFGTGTHATTHLCLDWVAHAQLKNQTIIDYGCGSGILGIGALLMGAKKVFAVDYCPQAITATQNNQIKNNLSQSQMTVHMPDDGALKGVQADLVIANILIGPLLALRETFVTHLKPLGTLVLSGILEEQIPLLKQAYEHDFDICEVKTLDGWCLVHATRKAQGAS